jgi:hypothetical protein
MASTKNFTRATIDCFEPLPVASPITIAAGRYYKTRDGLKVGPMYFSDFGDDQPWSDGSRWYSNDGSWRGDSQEYERDLIAEWVDEPAAIANDNAAPAKFKVGDRVVSASSDQTNGLFGVIIDDDKSDVPYRVRFDNFDDGHGAKGNEWWLQASEIQFPALVTTTPAIVALIENGAAKPATRPVVHASQEAATIEASRLALAHPGHEFGVFVLADSKIADVVEEVVKKTVLRPAA